MKFKFYDFNEMEVVLLSRNPELLNETAELLNKQWKRSTSARVQSLEKSVTQLPDSLLLMENEPNGKKVIGHSRLTRVLEDPYGCWIGSVVICEEKRKKGYGKYLMQKTEEYAKVLQFQTAYLNTHDQQGFYEHLGYSYCDPVSSVSFSWNGYHPLNIFSNERSSQNEALLDFYPSDKNHKNINTDYQNEHLTTNTSVPPPPPMLSTKGMSNVNDNLTDTSIPPPPPMPSTKGMSNLNGNPTNSSIPPPPPMPSSKGMSNFNGHLKSSLGQYWMKKKL